MQKITKWLKALNVLKNELKFILINSNIEVILF